MNIYGQNFDLNLYKIFCTVAETKSISKASEVLFVSQQAVSYSIKQLEIALEGRLFFRTPKGVVLTPEAEKLYTQVKESLNNIITGQKIYMEDKELKSGYIYICCNASLFDVCVYKYVATFHEIYPNIEIHVVSKPSNDLFKMLMDHELDLVAKKFTNDDTAYSRFSVKMFSEITNCFIGNKKYKSLADKKQVSLEELNQYPLLLPNKDSYERKYLEEDFKKRNLELKPLMDFTSHAPIIKFVKEGFGIGHAIKEQVEDDLKNESLFQIPVEGITFTNNIGMIYDEKYLTFAAGKFISIL